MKLIDDWKSAHRWFSVQAMTLAMAIQGAWPAIPEDMRSTLPPSLVHWVTIALLVAGVAGRLIDQPAKQP